MEVLLSVCVIKRQFHLRRYDESVRHKWPYQATAAISGTFLADRRVSKASEVAGTGASGWATPSAPPGAGVAPQPHFCYLLGAGRDNRDYFDSNIRHGTAGVLSVRDTGPRHPDWRHRVRPGSARASKSRPHHKVAGTWWTSVLSFSFPWCVLLAVVTDIAFESEEC